VQGIETGIGGRRQDVDIADELQTKLLQQFPQEPTPALGCVNVKHADDSSASSHLQHGFSDRATFPLRGEGDAAMIGW